MKRYFAWLLAMLFLLSAARAETPDLAAGMEARNDAARFATGAAPDVTPLPDEAADAMTTLEPEETVTPAPGRLAGIRIGIDPGHQEKADGKKEAISPTSKKKKPRVSSGTRGARTKIPEYITVLEISFALRDALLREGAEVFMTRERHDVNISNQERARMMNDLGCDLVLRIHCDGSTKKSANGIGLFVNKSFAISEESHKAAEAILPRMVEATGAKHRGVYERDTYTGLNWSTVPSILVECGYLTNPDEDERLNDPDYQRLLAEGMTEGICDYFNAGIGE